MMSIYIYIKYWIWVWFKWDEFDFRFNLDGLVWEGYGIFKINRLENLL